jgi:uroporphyrinogen decarboxylase
MLPREMILEAIHHRQPPVVPYTFSCEESVAERLDKHYGGKHWRQKHRAFMQNVGAISTMRKLPTQTEGLQVDPYGTTWRVDRRPFHLETPALPNPSFDGYKWPAIKEFHVAEKELKWAQEFSAEQRKDYFILGHLGWGLFETSWGMRGFENALMDTIAEPDFYAELLDRITEQFLQYIDYTCRMLPQLDAIMLGDDWGEQRGVIVGPERWRKFFKPRFARIYEAIHKRGLLVISHCCGSVVDIIPDVIELGLDVLESVQPEARGMNPYELKKRFGDKITFWGCLGSQSTIPFGTPAEITAEIRRLKREMGAGGGYILAAAKQLQPETPTENAVAIVEAMAEE